MIADPLESHPTPKTMLPKCARCGVPYDGHTIRTDLGYPWSFCADWKPYATENMIWAEDYQRMHPVTR